MKGLIIPLFEIVDIQKEQIILYEKQISLLEKQNEFLLSKIKELNDNFINNGGVIQLSIGVGNDSSEIDVKFSTLKSVSMYSHYLFNELTGDDILGVYGDLYYKLQNVINKVKTYTIVHELKNGIREVILHDLSSYGKILTRCDLIK